ncbi:hypothetical protein DEO72_LG2g7 [Vigna unguiculata]|uniref:Myb-like domain-containing protein n=1 Tax=Vigna unguiculata TaxID=3917 RepID=A0A4D6KT06_VIGUN|nr:hypothetical protein DEO72_LG2g7 [Vigna unguiculata]
MWIECRRLPDGGVIMFDISINDKKIEVVRINTISTGHQTESFSVHIPSTQEREGPSCHTIGQRRTRRSLSADELEALVRTVELLGVERGMMRWREVKLQAFSDADHRTFRDLKEKWNTLVHAARIPPLRRRGEPIPQELFDRVLTAHTLG